MVKYSFFLRKSHFTFGIPSAKYVYNLFCDSNNYCKGDLNGSVHETDKKLNCLGVPRVLQLTFIHFVMDLRK